MGRAVTTAVTSIVTVAIVIRQVHQSRRGGIPLGHVGRKRGLCVGWDRRPGQVRNEETRDVAGSCYRAQPGRSNNGFTNII